MKSPEIRHAADTIRPIGHRLSQHWDKIVPNAKKGPILGHFLYSYDVP